MTKDEIITSLIRAIADPNKQIPTVYAVSNNPSTKGKERLLHMWVIDAETAANSVY